MNICLEPYSNIFLSFLNEKKSKSRYNLHMKNIWYNILFRGSMSELFWKFYSIGDGYEYLNIWIKLPYSYFFLFIQILVWKTCGIWNFSDICCNILWHTNIFIFLFVSIVWYSLITDTELHQRGWYTPELVMMLCLSHQTLAQNYIKEADSLWSWFINKVTKDYI